MGMSIHAPVSKTQILAQCRSGKGIVGMQRPLACAGIQLQPYLRPAVCLDYCRTRNGKASTSARAAAQGTLTAQRLKYEGRDKSRAQYSRNSRIGKEPLVVPKGVKFWLDSSNAFRVKGPKGALEIVIPGFLELESSGEGELTLKKRVHTRRAHEQHGQIRTIIANMLKGVSTGHSRTVQLVGVGYRLDVIGPAEFAKLEDPKFGFHMRNEASDANKGGLQVFKMIIGLSHPVYAYVPKGVTATTNKTGTELTIEGADGVLISGLAGNLRKLKVPDAYKGKGIRYLDEVITLKKK